MKTRGIVLLSTLAAMSIRSSDAVAVPVVLNVATNVVQLDNSTLANNDAVALTDTSGSVIVQASGNSIFGPLQGEQYNSLAVQYRDANGLMQYGSVPNNGSKTFLGSHYDFGFLTDLAGGVPDNTGATTVTEKNAANTTIASGTINAGSLTPAQTGVAQISADPSGNAAFFDLLTMQNYLVSASGNASYDAQGDKYGSIVVQYRDAGNGISYDFLPIGTSKTIFGFNFRLFITDFSGQTADNTGSITVDVVPVPEPSTLILAALGLAIFARRTKRPAS
jgi:hypothetical protein